MPSRADQMFSLADLIDYELQMIHRHPGSHDSAIRLESGILEQGKRASLKAWLKKVRGPMGENFLQLRNLLSVALIVCGAVLGWGTVHGLLLHEAQRPINIFPFLAVFVVLPLLFLLVLLLKGLIARMLGRLPTGWVSASGLWILSRVMKKSRLDIPAVDFWQRLKSLHPRVFALQAWILSQTFALAYYLAAALAFLSLVTVNDYTFAWQTTLKMGPEVLTPILFYVMLPFAWLGSHLLPTPALIEATQYDRFLGSYLHPDGQVLGPDWWRFLILIILFYGCLPRLLLLLSFHFSLKKRLRSIRFDDFASEELWLRLQQSGLTWQAEPGTQAEAPQPMAAAPLLGNIHSLLVVRWRQAPFSDESLQQYFSERGLEITRILDAEGKDSEFQSILSHLRPGEALALVCDPWEMPGESFNRLRLSMREKLPSRTPIFMVVPELVPERDLQNWRASLKAFRDPYIGLLPEGKQL